MSKDITEHVRCSLSEIPDFLCETETTRLLELAESGRLENSDVFHNSVDTLLSQNFFEYWDLNRDDVINTDEVYILLMRRFWVLHTKVWTLVCIPRKHNWLVRYSMVYHERVLVIAMENAVANSINARYTQRTMRRSTRCSRICNSFAVFGLAVFSMAWYK